VAAVIADTGHGVPEIADLKLSALHLDGDVAGGQEASVDLDGESYPLTRSTVHVLTRWLAARGTLIAELEGSDPGYLWIPTKPGRPRGGVPSAKPGINPAAVRTLHASHRALVSQLLGTPLRPGALRAAAVSLAAGTGDAGELSLLIVAPQRHTVRGTELDNHAAPVRKTGQQTSVLCLPTSSVSTELTR
jgi:hypothetical protein